MIYAFGLGRHSFKGNCCAIVLFTKNQQLKEKLLLSGVNIGTQTRIMRNLAVSERERLRFTSYNPLSTPFELLAWRTGAECKWVEGHMLAFKRRADA